MEVDDFTATFWCNVAFIQGEALAASLTGLSRRPICHFNIVTSDYLGRRHPDFSGALSDRVKAVELLSRAVHTKSQKRLEDRSIRLRPRMRRGGRPWATVGPAGSRARALMSSGKRYFFVFSFTPSSLHVVESLWEFSIPEHGIKVPFLFVGRI